VNLPFFFFTTNHGEDELVANLVVPAILGGNPIQVRNYLPKPKEKAKKK
jgi:hypothetical protein